MTQLILEDPVMGPSVGWGDEEDFSAYTYIKIAKNGKISKFRGGGWLPLAYPDYLQSDLRVSDLPTTRSTK